MACGDQQTRAQTVKGWSDSGMNSTDVTKKALQAGVDYGVSPEDTLAAYNEGMGGNHTMQDYNSAMAFHGIKPAQQGGSVNSGGASGSGGGVNPYLGQMADAMGQQAKTQFERNIMPSLRGNAIQAGGYGGSRDAIAQGIAAGDMQSSLNSNIANLYGQSYESDQNRGLQRDLAAQQAQLARDQMNMQNNQFGQSLAWNKDQFGRTFGEQQRQFDKNFWQQDEQIGFNNLLAGQNLANQQSMLPFQQLQILSGLGGQLNAYDQALMDSDMNNFLRYASVVQPGAGLGASQIATGPAGSKGSGILGGALGGAAMGGQWGGPWGALGGGLLGGILGGS